MIKLPKSKDSPQTHRKGTTIMEEVSHHPDPHQPEDVDHGPPQKGGIVGLVFLTILVLAIIGTLAALPGFIGQTEVVKTAIANSEWWMENIGEYHPLILHLPIGIVFLTVLMEVCSWLSFGKYRPMTSVGLFLAVITGALACATGYVDMQIGGYTGEDWDNHMWAGIGFVGVLGLALLAKLWGRRSASKGPIYGILLFAAAGIMGFGAHIGGEKVHKTDPVKNTLVGLEIIKNPKESGKAEAVADTGPPAAEVQDRLAFAHVVTPILQGKCMACHSRDEKKKGGLLMDTFEDLIVGGSSQDGDYMRTLTPGDAKKSFLIEALNLPMDDDMHMPPEKKTQLETHEIEILTWWVNNIPEGETLDDKTLAEMGAPENILAAAAKLVTPEELAAAAKGKADAVAKIEAEKTAMRETLQTAIDDLKKDEIFKTSLNYTSQDSTDLEFTAVSLRKNLTDEGFAKLTSVSQALTVVNLGSSSVSEAALAVELPKMTNLKKLNLSDTETGDTLLSVLGTMENLEYLNLHTTKVTNEGIQSLKTLENLKDLYLWNTQVTEKGAEQLRKELPGLTINLGVN